MATVISKNEFISYDGKSKVDLSDLFVQIYKGEDPKLERVALTELYVKVNGKARKIKSYNEFMKHLKNDNVFTSENALQSVRHGLSKAPEVEIKGVNVPNNYTSIVVNSQQADQIVPYGLKRNLKVELADSSVPADKRYYFVEINGQEEFFTLNDLYFYDKTNKKRLLSDKTIDLDKLVDVQIYAPNGSKVERIYTEKQYVFPIVNASEKVDFEKLEKTTFNVSETTDKDSKTSTEFTTETKPLDRFYSQQKYVKKQVEDEHKPGKTKEVSMIEVKNFQMQPDGEYYSVVVDGFTKMVHKDNILDVNGRKVEDFTSMVGKAVQIQENGKIIGTSQPLTYEQAHLAYGSIKTYQETNKEAGEDTYLRLKNGEYVKEMEACKPISYKLVTLNNASYDAFLVKTMGADGKEKFVVVSKDYFDKHGDKTDLKKANAIKIARCEFDSKDCAVVQTTSRGEQVEQCSVVKKIKFASADVSEDAKEVAEAGVKAGYLQGDYKLTTVFNNGKLEELSSRGQRYEYSDTSYLPDYADNRHQYRSLKNYEMKIVNGKLVGGPKFDVGKGIKNSYAALGRVFASSFGIVMLGGIFTATIGGPLVAAAFMVGSAAAVPAIPIANMTYGLVKNSKRATFVDKAEYNQKANQKELEKRMQKLYERMTSKDYVPLPQARFEDEYNKLVNDIIALSSCSVENALVVENGVAKVTPENANAAKAYMEEFKEVQALLNRSNKDLEKVEKNFKKYDQKMKILEEEGKVIPPKFQKQFDEAKRKYENQKSNNAELKARHEGLMNYKGNPIEHAAHAERDRMLKVASVMRTAVYFKSESFKDHPLVQEALYGEKGLTDCSDLMTEEDVSLEDSAWTKDEIEAYRKKYADKSMNMLNNIEMDFKNGLMVDGVGVGLDDEEMSRSPEYERGYQWAKVKQAIEYVHNGLKSKQTKFENPKNIPQTKDEKTEENKKPEKTKTRLNKEVITSENSVAQQLEDQESKYYKDVMRNLTRKGGKFEMSKEDAAVAIFDFTTKVNQAHAQKQHAKDVFEKGSVDAYILTNVRKSMFKGATLQYQTPKQTPVKMENEDSVEASTLIDELQDKLKTLELEYMANETQINELQTKQERNVDILKNVSEAFGEVKTKQIALNRANERYKNVEDKIKAQEIELSKVATPEERDGIKSVIESMEIEAQKVGDRRYDCDSQLSIAKGRLDKLLKTYGFVGKSIDEIKQYMADIKEELDEKIADNRAIARQISAITAKTQENSTHNI